MDSSYENAVLRRKAIAGREVWQARAMSPAKAFKIAMARAADDLMDLALVVTSVAEDAVSAEAVVADLSADEMIVLLEGPNRALGLATLAMPVVVGTVENATVGRVLPGRDTDRRATRTDAAILAPLIDRVLGLLPGMLDGVDGTEGLDGFAFGDMLETPRLAELAIDAAEFRRFRMQVLLGGEKEGEISLIFPAVPARVAPAPEGAEDGAPDALPGFANAVMGVRAELSVVLHRLRMPLNAVTALRVGQVIEVPADALFETGLVAGNGKRVVEVQLGQSRGFRAVRLLPTRDAGQAAGGPARAAKGEAAGTGVAAIAAPGGVDDAVSASMQDLPDLSDLPELSDLPVLADIAETGGGIADIASADTGFAPDPMTPEAAEEEEEADLDLGGGFPMAAMGDLPPLD